MVELSSEARIEMHPKSGEKREVIIEFVDAGFRRAGDSPRTILSGISLAIHRGEKVVLLGKSGSGKTTLLKLINRLLAPTQGDVRVVGRSTHHWDPIRLRRGIGYVIQEVGLFPHLSVARNVTLVPALEGWPPDRALQRFQEVMQLVGLDPQEFAKRMPRELSGGQRQRVGVARALAADPPILLMDEPFAALDPVTRTELQREFLDLARRLAKTIVLVTHDLREALLLGSRVVLLEVGRIAADASPSEFLRLPHREVREFVASSQFVVEEGE
jgi:osmoprotectant transport system ATP-binding protein